MCSQKENPPLDPQNLFALIAEARDTDDRPRESDEIRMPWRVLMGRGVALDPANSPICTCGRSLLTRAEVCPACGEAVKKMAAESEKTASTMEQWLASSRFWAVAAGDFDEGRRCVHNGFAAQGLATGQQMLSAAMETLSEMEGDSVPGALVEIARNWLRVFNNLEMGRTALKEAENIPWGDYLEEVFEAWLELFGEMEAFDALQRMRDKYGFGELRLMIVDDFVRLAERLPTSVPGGQGFVRQCLESVRDDSLLSIDDEDDANYIARLAWSAQKDLDDSALARQIIQKARQHISSTKPDLLPSLDEACQEWDLDNLPDENDGGDRTPENVVQE